MWPTAWLSSSNADVLTFSMILMLIDIQVRALDLSGNSVYRHVECHGLTSHQQFCLVNAVTQEIVKNEFSHVIARKHRKKTISH